jgi:hypothetical protein
MARSGALLMFAVYAICYFTFNNYSSGDLMRLINETRAMEEELEIVYV